MNEMNSAPILPARLDWPSVIGTFLINFGALHHSVIDFLSKSLEASEFARYKEKPFKDQTLRIAQYVQDNASSIAKHREFEALLARVDRVRELRNHIAHGYFVFLRNKETKIWGISIALPRDLDQEYSPETRHVTFDELRKSLDELTELIEAFKRLAGFKPT